MIKEKHITFWAITKSGTPDKKRPVKRYALLFNLFKGWISPYRVSYSCSEFDTLKEVDEECRELDKLYATHQLPKLIKKNSQVTFHNSRIIKGKYDFSDGSSFWGYIVLDFNSCTCIHIGGYGFVDANRMYNTCKSINENMYERDYFFRDTNICPDDYEFKSGEYNGWLRFRWGDGKNAIDYVELPKQPKKKKKTQEEIREEIEENDYLDGMNNDWEVDLIESKFDDLLDKETRKKLMDRYGW